MFNIFEDEEVKVIIHNEESYLNMAAQGARVLFDFHNYRFLDCIDGDDKWHYLIIPFFNESEVFLELDLEPFYQLITLQFIEPTHETLLYTLNQLF